VCVRVAADSAVVFLRVLGLLFFCFFIYSVVVMFASFFLFIYRYHVGCERRFLECSMRVG